MPVGIVSSTASNAIYLVSMLLLLALLLRPLSLVYDGATRMCAVELSSSLAEELDSLSPGMKVIVRVTPVLGVPVHVSLSGHDLTATVGSETVSSSERWPLPDAILSPGEYFFSLSGGGVVIEETRIG